MKIFNKHSTLEEKHVFTGECVCNECLITETLIHIDFNLEKIVELLQNLKVDIKKEPK